MKRPLGNKTGVLLVEVMLCMAIGTVLLAVITTIFVRVVVMNPAAREHLETTITLGRLAEQFRSDVHAASEVSPSAAGAPAARLSLQRHGDARIEYLLVDGGLRRTAVQGDQVRQQERFVLPGMKVLGWEMPAQGREVSLIIGRLLHPDDDAGEVRYRFPITARLGRDHRYALPEAPK